MRLLTVLFFAASLSFAETPEHDAVAAVQRVFDGIAAHDGAVIRSVMLPESRIYVVRDAGTPSAVALDDLIAQIAASKSALLERFTGSPNVLVHGRIAQVWGEYVFLRDGKISHCGIDSASLLNTAEGWKITAITYTAETTGCSVR